MDGTDVGVYGEAKGEYTRQLCVFLVPALETYFLDLLQEAKQNAAGPSKELLTFQNMLQGIPDWNQDKVVRETGRIQSDTKCDYLEELLTAVFIAHTKVLSAIRLTSKQKKLQITIPKLDHFLHRVLSECARSLWSSAFLFAGANSIERQKNLRQVEHLLQEAILQAIRGLLPVKSILREYLVEEEEEADVESEHVPVAAVEDVASVPHIPSSVDTVSTSPEPLTPAVEHQPAESSAAAAAEKVESHTSQETTALEAQAQISTFAVVPAATPAHVEAPQLGDAPVVDLDALSPRPSVQFNDKAMVFSESGLEEVDLIEEEPDMNRIEIGNEILPMDEFEDLEKPAVPSAPSPIAFEELPAA